MKNLNSRPFLQAAGSFYNLPLSEKDAELAGYAALISEYQLKVPLPDILCLISQKHKRIQKSNWLIFGPKHKPKNTLYAQLVFALKYEGVNLSVLSALFHFIAPQVLEEMIGPKPIASYSRRIWFLYEWITDKRLKIPDSQATKVNFVDVLDPKLQYPGPVRRSKRHRVNNNLPGVPHFCPLIRRTKLLESFINSNLNILAESKLKQVSLDLLMRAAAFLLLEDSKASYVIEGETPPHNRAQRWASAINQAGKHPLSHEAFLRLQQTVIGDFKYTHPGYRVEGGFIGQHDRTTYQPIPAHISARFQDVYNLMEGLIETDRLLNDSSYHAVLAATAIAFGFVFIHPFEDGNGRVHRYLIHHVLAKKGFTPEGVIFPISYVILERLNQYRAVLETYSTPRLRLIKWRPTVKNNIEVLNETIDLYRYFDATQQAEFLFSCIKETVEQVIPKEIDYLQKYDEMKSFIESYIEMPDRLVNLLILFLRQGNGKFSKRAKENEFKSLTEDEMTTLESKFQSIFGV